MHPAFSVIFFTVSSGTGYGVLFLLGILGFLGRLPSDPVFGFVSMAVGIVLVGAGLLSSMLHLGHPERAWRAFSQWKTSWLSREGVASVVSFLPAFGFLYLWVMENDAGNTQEFLGAVMSFVAFVTVYCTAMIYRSLPPVHQWANRWTVPSYLAMALAGGGIGLVALYISFGKEMTTLPLCAAGAVLLAWAVKTGYWHFVDHSRSASTPETATGLGQIGKVRQLEGPHTEDNYLLKEMGFRIGQKHAAKLRRYANIFGFLLPALLLIGVFQTQGTTSIALSAVAAISFAIGAVTERWLFFAEARHSVTLFYGR